MCACACICKTYPQKVVFKCKCILYIVYLCSCPVYLPVSFLEHVYALFSCWICELLLLYPGNSCVMESNLATLITNKKLVWGPKSPPKGLALPNSVFLYTMTLLQEYSPPVSKFYPFHSYHFSSFNLEHILIETFSVSLKEALFILFHRSPSFLCSLYHSS